MRRFLTLGLSANGTAKILHDTDEPKMKHLQEFKKLLSQKRSKTASKEFAEVVVVDLSAGAVKRIQLTADGANRKVGHVRRAGAATPAEKLNLSSLTVPDLKEIAAQENIDLAGARTKQDHVDAIEYDRLVKGSVANPQLLHDLTIPQLLEIAEREKISIPHGAKKKETIDLISAERLGRVTPPAPGSDPEKTPEEGIFPPSPAAA